MKKIKKYIKKHNDLFAITGMIILILISCIVIVGVITVANYHYFITHDDIEINYTYIEAPTDYKSAKKHIKNILHSVQGMNTKLIDFKCTK